MTDGERRIRIIIANYTLGKYTLAELKDILRRGLKHIDCLGVMGVDKQFILNLAAIETAIARIERQQSKKENR